MRPNPTPPLYYAPLVPVAAAFTLGILFDRYLVVALQSWLVMATLMLLGASLASRRKQPIIPWLLLAFTALGGAHHNQQCQYVAPGNVARILTEKPMLVRARGMLCEDWTVRPKTRENPLVSQPRTESSLAALELHALQKEGDWIPHDGKVRLTVPGRLEEIRVGDEVELLGWMNLPVTPANPGEWDYSRWLRDQGISAEMHIRKAQDLITRLNPGGFSFDRLLARIRHYGQEVLQHRIGENEYGLSAALLLGQNNALPAADWDHYVRTGVIHVLAISGQHLVILGIFIRFLLRLARLDYRWAALIVALLLFIYAMVTGGRPSAMRAAAMVMMGCLGILLGKRVFPANTFSLAWIVVLILNPGDLFNSGFQLSFLAVAVLIWGIPYWSPTPAIDPLQQLIEESEPRLLRFSRFLFREIRIAYKTTLYISVSLIPLIIYWQNLISLSGLLIGPPVILLSTIALLAGFGLLFDNLLGGLFSGICTFLLKWSLALANDLVLFADKLTWGCWYTGPLPIGCVILFYTLLVGWLIWLQWRNYPLPRIFAQLKSGHFLKALLVTMAIGFLWPQRDFEKDELRVEFISVGHGGCTLVELPDGRTLLYDTGSLAGPDIVQRHVAPFLWSRGIRRIDEVILSHADLDHFNGLPALLDRFAIGQITTTPSFADKNAPGVKEVLRVLETRGMNLRAIHRPMTWKSGDVSFQVLHPPAEGPPGIENVRSLVLLLEHQGHHFLFTGDIEKVGLDQVLSQPISSIDVLMSPHHGSVTANPAKLFDWAKPKLVVVNNSESGFSSKMKNDREILTWSTGTAGLITIRSHRSGVVAETFRTGERRVIASGSP